MVRIQFNPHESIKHNYTKRYTLVVSKNDGPILEESERSRLNTTDLFPIQRMSSCDGNYVMWPIKSRHKEQ